MVACEVSKHPPWSIATSTITAPFFMLPIMSRRTSLGAAAPGISTAPTTRSASCSDFRMVQAFEASVTTWLLINVVEFAQAVRGSCR